MTILRRQGLREIVIRQASAQRAIYGQLTLTVLVPGPALVRLCPNGPKTFVSDAGVVK